MTKKYFYDLHCHTLRSKDSPATLKSIIEIAKKRGLDGVAITDHNYVYQGPDFLDGIDIISGSEITLNDEGHLLAFYVKKEIPFGLSLEETVSLIRGQGGYAVLAHPFRSDHGWMLKKDKKSIEKGISLIDGLEAGNASDKKKRRDKVLNFSKTQPKSFILTAGSDAHMSGKVGFGVIEVNERINKENFKKVLSEGRIIVRDEADAFSKEARIFKKITIFLSKLLMIHKSKFIKSIFFKFFIRNYFRIRNKNFLKIKFNYKEDN